MAIRCCFMFFTGMFALLGLFLLVAGSVVHVGLVSIDDFVDSTIQLPTIFIIVLGGVMFFTSIIGYCGASVYNGCLLYLFAAILIVILLLKVVTGVMGIIYGKDPKRIYDEKIDDAVKTYNTSSISREAMDKIQRTLACCGSNDYNDYSGYKLPGSCCVDKENECLKTGDELDHFIIGCKEQIHDYAYKINAYLGGVLLGLIVVEIVGVILAIIMATLAAHGPPLAYI